jgi:hypothetical protein
VKIWHMKIIINWTKLEKHNFMGVPMSTHRREPSGKAR